MHRTITMHALLRQTDGQTHEHHGNSAMVRSVTASRAKTRMSFSQSVMREEYAGSHHILAMNWIKCGNLSVTVFGKTCYNTVNTWRHN